MTLVLTDTAAGGTRPFVPIEPGRVGIYVCGPTVQDRPHVGHARSAIAFDILRRWLMARGHAVTFVRNVTDVDDKIIHNAGHESITPWELADRNTRAFNAAADALGVLPPTIEPRATGHIPEMVALMQTLIDRGHAYPSGGDVYFDVRGYAGYGSVSGQRPDAMLATEKTDVDRPKRDPLDFALWKAHRPGEPYWDTPWGPGRPGWHLECSAMSAKYLGQPFDIHGGGLDLVFPHHENEAAQSCCAVDAPYANYWLHNGLVNIGGEKMSKSLGNSTVVSEVLETVRAPVLRYALGSAHYRSPIDYSDAALVEAAAAYGRLETFVRNAVDALGDLGEAEALAAERPGDAPESAARQAFRTAMDDDLAVSRALAAVFEAVSAGNKSLESRGDRSELAGWLAVVREGLDVLGLDPVAQWPGGAGDASATIAALVEIALEARAAARARRDYAEADAIRDRLNAAHVVVEDVASNAGGGVRWHLAKG